VKQADAKDPCVARIPTDRVHRRMFSGFLAGVTRAEVWSEGRDPEKAPARD